LTRAVAVQPNSLPLRDWVLAAAVRHVYGSGWSKAFCCSSALAPVPEDEDVHV